MRKKIGWLERTPDGKYEIRVIFDGGNRIRWQRFAKPMEHWESFEPTPDHWAILCEKTRFRYQRRQAPYKDLQLVERLAAQSQPTPEPSPPRVGRAGDGASRPPRPCPSGESASRPPRSCPVGESVPTVAKAVSNGLPPP